MAGALIGALRVTLGIDTAAFEEGLSNAQRSLGSAGKSLQDVGDRMSAVGSTLSVAVTAPLLAAGAAAMKGAQDQAQAMAQVNAALASMGPVAQRTSDQLLAASDALELNSLYDGDEILRKVTANLLTFGNVAGTQFDRAQQAAVDLATRMEGDLQGATLMVGKALNDPIKGIAALSRVGIQLSDSQKELIRSMVATGNTAGAQNIILGELERQFGGAAKAAADTDPWRKAQVAIGQAGDVIGEALLPIIPKIADAVKTVADAFLNLSPGMQEFIIAGAAVAAAVGPVLMVLGSLVSMVGGILPALAPVVALIGEAGLGAALAAAATAAAPFVAAGVALAAAWVLFGDKIGPVLSALSEKLQATLGPKLMALFETVKATLTALWEGPFGQAIRIVIDVLGDLGAAYTAILGEALIRIISALVDTITNAFTIIGDIFNVFAALLRGDFAGAWTAMKTLVADVVNGWLTVLNDLVPGASAAMRALYEGIKSWIGDRLGALFDWVKGKIKEVGDAFYNLWDRVVGHSYIPDLFDGIAANAARLQPEFVRPILGGIAQVDDAFGGLSFPDLVVTAPKVGANDNEDPDAETSPTSEGADSLRETFQQTFSDGVKAALKGDLGGFFQNWFEGIGERALTKVLDAVSDQLFNVLSTAFGGSAASGGGGGLGDIFTSVLGSLFGGRASGGPVLANTPYVVGEKRPELFVPSTAGRIEPDLNRTGRGAANDVGMPSMNFNFYGPVTNPQEIRRSAAQAAAQLARTVAAGKRGI